ncbi:roadblock/LC7 domain-containing protein [Streptomyces sp. NBC_00820]|uniref:roadblock/LC7 domain-containing protein n=1 Tax=Streptomyces sp. NBC_00820 TaxID=2975842 RepID=UPI002ED4002F|nr:roadblock/LC7 domain-containing protein [Streptomyces sp. NBC_00820]
MSNAEDMEWLLSNLVAAVPQTIGAVVTSSDGIPKHFHGVDQDDADAVSAVASGVFSLCRGVSRFFPKDPKAPAVQTILETSVGLMFAARVGDNSVLAVLAEQGVDVGVVGYQMRMLANRAAPILGTPARTAAAG